MTGPRVWRGPSIVDHPGQHEHQAHPDGMPCDTPELHLLDDLFAYPPELKRLGRSDRPLLVTEPP